MNVKIIPSDETLALALSSRSREAFQQVYERFAPYIYGMVNRTTNDQLASNERFQEVFVEIWRSAPKASDTHSLTIWIMQVTATVLGRYIDGNTRMADQAPTILSLLTTGHSTEAAAKHLGIPSSELGPKLREELMRFKLNSQ